MTCIKCDNAHGESSCEFAEFNPAFFGFQCKHPCVLIADEARWKAEKEREEALARLEKYRKAIRPFVDNCRAVVKAVDGEKEGETK